MQIGTFRKNVMKTVTPKQVRLGLRVAAKNTTRTNVAHYATNLKTDTGRLISALAPYVLGQQFSHEMRIEALAIMGDMGQDLIVLCKILKIKTPTASRKLKLVGTRGAALLQLDNFTTDLMELITTGLFAAPQMTKVKKLVVMPNKNGAKEERDVEIVDANAEQLAEATRQENAKPILNAIVDLYWRLCTDMFKAAPEVIFEAKLARLQSQHPEIDFELDVPDEEGESESASK